MAEKNNSPLVSVCVQTYQHVEYIRECLDSILSQKTNFPFEIILGEDESTDGTREICLRYAEKYPEKIRLFLRSRKDVIYIAGKASGRYNFVENLKACKGKYIAILEGDDYWSDPYKLQKQVDILEEREDIVACHHKQLYAVKDDRGGYSELDEIPSVEGLYEKTYTTIEEFFLNRLRIKSRTIMFRRSVIKKIPDWFFNVAYGDIALPFILGKSGNFYYINDAMAVYRLTNRGVSSPATGNINNKKFKINYFKNCIEIWDYAIKYYNYSYNEQYRYAINYYINRIIYINNKSLIEFLNLLLFNFFSRKVEIGERIRSLVVLKKGFIKILIGGR